MPFALLIIGLALVVSGLRGQSSALVSLVKADFTGQHNFIDWIIAILIIGSLGYIDSLRPLSRIFTALVIVVLFLSDGGFFTQFSSAISGVNAANVPSGSAAVSSAIPPAPVAPSASTLEPSISSLSELL